MKPGGKPWLLLGALILIGSPLFEGGTTYLPVTGLRLAVLVLAAGWLWQGLKEASWTLAGSRFNILILIFWGLTAVSLARSDYSYMTAYWYVNIFCLILLFYLALQTATLPDLERDRILRGSTHLLILMAAVESIWGILDFALGRETRASAGFFNPNGLAGYLLAVSPLVLARLLFARPGDRHRLASLAVLALFLAAILCTRSRALAVAFVSFGALLFLRFRLKSLLLLAAGLTLLFAVPNPLRERIFTLRSADPYAWERLRIYAASLDMIRDHPAGVGLGLYKYYYPRYGRAVESVKVGRYEKSANTAHSEALHLAAELSPLAPVLLLAMALIWILLAFLRLGRSPTPNPDALGAAAGLLAITTHALIDANLHETAIAVVAVILAANVSIALGPAAGGIRLHRLAFYRPKVLKAMLLILAPLIALALVFISATYGLTEVYSRVPDSAERARKLSRLAPYNPGYAPLPDNLSQALFVEARENAQVELMEKAIHEEHTAQGLNPNNYLYAEGLGVLYLELSKGLNAKPPLVTVAERYFLNSLELYPNNPFVLQHLAEIARLRRRQDQEERWLRDALAREPYFFRAREQLIVALLKRGQDQAAQAEYYVLAAQIEEIRKTVKQRPQAFPSTYQRQLLSLPHGRLETLQALLNLKAEPSP